MSKAPRMHVVFPDKLYDLAVREGVLDRSDPTAHRYSDLQAVAPQGEEDGGVRL